MDKNQTDSKKDLFESTRASRIYVLPNLMTAGNLFCGFAAVIKCIQAQTADILDNPELSMLYYNQAVWFILGALIFDLLDGRLARLGGRESLFGKEFDSIADIISFGMAPALLVFFLILSPTEAYPYFQRIGWLIGFIYLLCAGVRLARFNVITHPAVYSRSQEHATKDFIGLPVPAAAGTIATLVFFLNAHDMQRFAIILPFLMLLIAFLMVSSVRYPSFKEIDWRTRTRYRTFILALAAAVVIFLTQEIGLVIVFLGYIFYGFFRHLRKRSVLSKKLKSLKKYREKARRTTPEEIANKKE